MSKDYNPELVEGRRKAGQSGIKLFIKKKFMSFPEHFENSRREKQYGVVDLINSDQGIEFLAWNAIKTRYFGENNLLEKKKLRKQYDLLVEGNLDPEIVKNYAKEGARDLILSFEYDGLNQASVSEQIRLAEERIDKNYNEPAYLLKRYRRSLLTKLKKNK